MANSNDISITDTKQSSEETLPYFAKVSAIIRQMEELNKNLTPALIRQHDEAELWVRLEYVNELNCAFDKYQSVREEIDSCETLNSDRMSFVSLYFEVKAKLKRQLNEISKINVNQRSSTMRQLSINEPISPPAQRKTKVPEIQLPKFSGNYSEWPNFFSLFSTIIDENIDLSTLEKFHYLRANLRDTALETIASLELNEANYEESLKLLKNRFDNKLLNFQSHIKEIFGLSCVESGSATSLRKLSDKINAHLRAINTIGNQQQIIDGLLIHLVTTKLDKKLLLAWEESLQTNELPTWTSMTEFLERRCRMAENVENSAVGKPTKQICSKKSTHNYKHVHISAANATSSCLFCDANDHYITSCSRFMNLSPSLRLKEAKASKLCLNCLKKGHMLKACISGTCRKCSSKHHTLLHIENIAKDKLEMLPTALNTAQTVLTSSNDDVNSKPPFSTGGILLATAIVLIKNRFGDFIPCRIILDSASQLNLITNRFVNQLKLKCTKACTTISGIGDGNFAIDKSVEVFIKSRHGKFSTFFNAMVVPRITDYQPNINANISDWKIPNNITLADPSFNKGGRIDALIGAELFFNLMSVGQIKLAATLPTLQKTLLGWVVAGGVFQSHHSWSLAATSKINQDGELDAVIRKFWEVENNFRNSDSLSKEEIFCENHFLKNASRLGCGSYCVRLPVKEGSGTDDLGDSYQLAVQRLKGLEKKFKRYPEIKIQYAEFMSEYLALNHMSLVSPQASQKKYFLPHHCVQKLDSTTTKLRVVFDGSANTTTGFSLNDVLLAGPTIQPKLFNTLLRYRCFKITISGDICKMYRCVRVACPDNYLQCILWRDSDKDEIKIYKLDTVTYGTKPAAFLAIRSMQELARNEEKDFPVGSKIVRRDFYVDDMLSGGDTIQEVIEIRRQVTALLQRGNFLIRKWCSNTPEVLNGIPQEQREKFLKFNDGTDVTKMLGLMLDPISDNFIFSFNPLDNCTVVTKRSILSSIARLYDPLGLIGPIITKAKIFMQHLWKTQLQWDESLPQSLHSAWLEFTSQFDSVQYFKFPRCVLTTKLNIQIHAFCDASLTAYGACVYVRSEAGTIVTSSLLCSKSRVAPLKTLTVPKLELSAAYLLAELLEVVVKTLPFNCDVHCWSDSMVVLSWLREQSSNFNVFVSNRVSRIQILTSNMTWHYVPSNLNPADILSRGSTPKDLLHATLWFSGPAFLCSELSLWPANIEFLTELPERRKNTLIISTLVDLSLQCKYYNSFVKLQRIFAYIFKFVYPKLRSRSNILTPIDIKNGTHLLIRNIQKVHFTAELKALNKNENLPASSKLQSLTPIIDSFGLVRVGGRLQNSTLDFDARHPIILPKNHPVTSSLIMHFHYKLLHAGPQVLLASVRQHYWPIGGRKLISSIISKCIRCFKMKPKLVEHIMGSLPADRVTPNKAFYVTGVDFCGPFYYKSEVRNRAAVKCYVSMFICFSTKATHLEVVQDLSTPSFLAALRRFIAIRGKPNIIWSDNATNFVGAKNELADLKQLFLSKTHQQSINNQCLEDGIEWKFIPPRSPHFGGLWEAAVKSAKFHFYRTVGLNKLTCDELRTLVYQISAILNSRPLCPVSENVNDLEVLTPGHFLIGGPLVAISEPNFIDADVNRLSRWQRVSQLHQIFWRKWSSSYLSLLQERTKWRVNNKNITCGAMVILKDENQPPLKWQLGRVADVILGSDGVTRVAVIRVQNGLIKRAVSKLAVLPIETSVEGPMPPTGGGC